MMITMTTMIMMVTIMMTMKALSSTVLAAPCLTTFQPGHDDDDDDNDVDYNGDGGDDDYNDNNDRCMSSNPNNEHDDIYCGADEGDH